MNKPNAKNENETSDVNENAQYTLQSQQGFMIRSGNQNFRFQGPQNFIHQQPPPMAQNPQYSGHRGQIMSNTNMNMYQNAGQTQMMQPPPQTAPSHQYIQQEINAYQQNSNFHPNNQQGNISRFNSPQQQQQQQQQNQSGSDGMMTGSYQQQPRFRQWWNEGEPSSPQLPPQLGDSKFEKRNEVTNNNEDN